MDTIESTFQESSGAMPVPNDAHFTDQNLTESLNWLCDEIRKKAGIRIVVEDHGMSKYPDKSMQAFLCRILRDVLSSIAEDSGARLARLILRCDGYYVEVALEDDGSGLDVSQTYREIRGVGRRERKLVEIRECIRKSGGFFHASAFDKNRIMIVMPV